MSAFYNEIDTKAAHCINAVMSGDLIPFGKIDTRSIKELTAHDLAGIHQAHFFAGAGAWAYAARLAGWPDDWPLWTGSCPCQPFSQAGRRAGTADERHLWPDFHRLIAAGRPDVVVGEQVAGAAGYDWFDGVSADLEREGYEAWAVDIPAAAVDAPHIRQRLYWAAFDRSLGDGAGKGFFPAAYAGVHRSEEGAGTRDAQFERRDGAGGLADAPDFGQQRAREAWGRRAGFAHDHRSGVTLGDAFEPGLEGLARHGDGARGRAIEVGSVAKANGGDVGHTSSHGWQQGQGRPAAARHGDQPASAHGGNGSFWSNHEWLRCHDGKARRTKPGIRLLVDGLPGRVSQWRIAGNSIVIPLAVEFLKAVKEEFEMRTTPAFPQLKPAR